MLMDSGLLENVENYALVDGQPMYIYGELACPLHVHLQEPTINTGDGQF